MRNSMNPRSWVFRCVALVTAFCFFNLEMGLLMQGQLAVSRAEAVGKKRGVGVFVFAKKAALQSDAQVVQTMMRARVVELGGVKLLTGSPEPPVNLGATVAPKVEEGFDALADREHAAAQVLFQDAYDVLSRHTGQLNRRLMAKTLKGLGVARAMAGQIGPAQEMMGASVNMWPDQQPAEYAYSRDVLQTFKGTQRKQMNQAAGTIMVATTPEGAEVSVDGVVRGVGPISVPELAAGRHWVSVAQDGYVRSGVFVDVAPGESLGHRVVLEPRPNMEAWDTVIDQMPKAFRSKRTAKGVMPALVSILEADEVIVLQLDKRGGYKLKGWHQSADGLAPVKLTLARDASFITNLHGFVDGTLQTSPDESVIGILDAPPADTTVMEVGGDPSDELFIDPNDPILKTRKKRRARSITKEWWFWTAIGGTAAALTVGAIVLFSQQDEGKGPVGDLVINFNKVGGD